MKVHRSEAASALRFVVLPNAGSGRGKGLRLSACDMVSLSC
jgi:hypothetical protein